MPSYKKAPQKVKDMAKAILEEFEHHKPTLDAGVRVDLLMAYPDYDEATENPLNDALRWHGTKALGVCRVVSLKDRTKGLGDVEITLDGHWWDKDSDEKEQRALLDHELYHIVVTRALDDLGRPKIKMRKHDVQVGWFAMIAKQHGAASQERIQASQILEAYGQFFFPSIVQETGRMGRLEITPKKK